MCWSLRLTADTNSQSVPRSFCGKFSFFCGMCVFCEYVAPMSGVQNRHVCVCVCVPIFCVCVEPGTHTQVNRKSERTNTAQTLTQSIELRPPLPYHAMRARLSTTPPALYACVFFYSYSTEDTHVCLCLPFYYSSVRKSCATTPRRSNLPTRRRALASPPHHAAHKINTILA